MANKPSMPKVALPKDQPKGKKPAGDGKGGMKGGKGGKGSKGC